MIKYNKVDMAHVKKSIKDIPDIMKPYDEAVVAVYFFGSFSTKNVTPLSDIDIAILYKDALEETKTSNLHAEVFGKLADLLRTEEIDLINLNTAPLSFRYNIIKDGQLIYYSNKDKVIDFHSETVTYYLDFKPYREEINRAFIEGILKEI
jgi:predicted nucleotidyltransferase